MSELDDPIAALVEQIGTMTRKDIEAVVVAVEKFSPERNQALLGARQLAFQHYSGWLERLNEVENAAVRRYKEVSAQADTLELTVFRVALQGATIATMVKPRLPAADYRRLTRPASKVISWLADESGIAHNSLTPPAPEVDLVEDEDQDNDEPSSEETQMAVATKSKKKLSNAVAKENGVATSEVRTKPMAQAQAQAAPELKTKVTQTKGKLNTADRKPAPVKKQEPAPAASADHPTTKHLAAAKKVGVRVANNPHGGYHVTVVGTLYRALSGVFDSAAAAKKAAGDAGLEVKAMPKAK